MGDGRWGMSDEPGGDGGMGKRKGEQSSPDYLSPITDHLLLRQAESGLIGVLGESGRGDLAGKDVLPAIVILYEALDVGGRHWLREEIALAVLAAENAKLMELVN